VNLLLPLTRLYLLASLRKQVHLATLVMAALLLLLPAYINTLSLGREVLQRVATDFGLTLISYFMVGMGLALGSLTVPAEVESRSLYPVLARPISRGIFLVAHLLAIAVMLLASVLLLGVCLMAALATMLKEVDPLFLLVLYGAYLQAVVAAALAMLFSIRLKPAASATLGVTLFLVGSFSSDLFALLLSWMPPLVAHLLKAVIPDFSAFAWKIAVVQGQSLPVGYVLAATLYGVGWVALALGAANHLFEEVDL
jgi:Cu-processing system permease protein